VAFAGRRQDHTQARQTAVICIKAIRLGLRLHRDWDNAAYAQ